MFVESSGTTQFHYLQRAILLDPDQPDQGHIITALSMKHPPCEGFEQTTGITGAIEALENYRGCAPAGLRLHQELLPPVLEGGQIFLGPHWLGVCLPEACSARLGTGAPALQQPDRLPGEQDVRRAREE